MKINKKNQNHKKIAIVISAVLALSILGYGAYAYSAAMWPFASSNDETLEQTSEDESINNDESTTESDPASELPAKYAPGNDSSTDESDSEETPSDAPPKAIEVPQIERASQSGHGSPVKIVASLQRSSDGKCQAILQKGSQKVKRTSPIVVAPANYNCTFSIPVSSFPTSGTWTMTVSHLLDSSVSTSEVREVEIQK